MLGGIQRLFCNTSIAKFGTPPLLTCLRHKGYDMKKSKYLKDNDIIYPPQAADEERRKGYICYVKPNIKYSPLNMWYIAGLIRGMTVDEATKQLSFLHKKGALIAKEAILDAQKQAAEHNIEFKSDLWIAHAYSTKSLTLRGARCHGRRRVYPNSYRFCNLFIRLEEGPPPKSYSKPTKTQSEALSDWMKRMRSRKIPNTL